MPSWGVHIALANKLNKKLNLGDDFVIGNVLPDATNGFIIKDISNIISHAKTHYNFEGANHPPKNDINKFLEVYGNKLNNPLIFGSLIHIMTDNYFNKYTRKNHIDTIDGETVAILNDGTILKGITPWKLKQEDFSKFADYLIYNENLGKQVEITSDTLSLVKELNYELSLEDIKLIVEKINSIINKRVNKINECRMFTLEELSNVFNDCYTYLDKEIDFFQKKKKLERR